MEMLGRSPGSKCVYWPPRTASVSGGHGKATKCRRCCASLVLGKNPHLSSGQNQEITWAQPVHGKNRTVFSLPLEEAEKLLGMETFTKRYAAQETSFSQQEVKQELQDWVCEVAMGNASVKLVCCPEDKVCAKRCNDQTMCSQCWVPLCRSCQKDLVWHKKLPAAALSNDMMVYYGPRDACRKEVTVMEMLCASPCLTTMICFSLGQ